MEELHLRRVAQSRVDGLCFNLPSADGYRVITYQLRYRASRVNVRDDCRLASAILTLHAFHNSRNAVVTGSRAARIAGNRPPTKPIASAHFRPIQIRSGPTRNLNINWVKPFSVDAL